MIFSKPAPLGAGFFIAARSTIADETTASTSPNEKLNFACVGVGGKGDSDSNHVSKHGNIAAICDIDDKTLAKKASSPAFANAKKFNDFRELFDKMGDKIDAVTVSIPDHNHAVVAMAAIKLGKHVYCQKPMTHNIAEARALREAAKKYNVVTQMGNQGTASDELRRGAELLMARKLGPVREVHVWTNRPIWPQAPRLWPDPRIRRLALRTFIGTISSAPPPSDRTIPATSHLTGAGGGILEPALWATWGATLSISPSWD